jgi:hypothetical protein
MWVLNIIVFDFIRPYAANLIFDKMINNIIYRLKDKNKIELILEEKSAVANKP